MTTVLLSVALVVFGDAWTVLVDVGSLTQRWYAVFYLFIIYIYIL